MRHDKSPRLEGRVVARIADEMLKQIRDGQFQPGRKLPSVRELANQRDISAFSASEIYGTLVATGAVEARPGRGYFVTRRRANSPTQALPPEFPIDSVWEIRRQANEQAIKTDAGCGWLPTDWLHGDGIRAALRGIAREPELHVEGYGNPLGLGTLRAYIGTQLETRGIDAREDQILLTQGANQALDLIVRECLKPGDRVAVEDPGYPPLFEILKRQKVQMIGIPRSESGPDADALHAILKRRRIRFFFTNTTCHNPTGMTTSPPVAHRILELANRYDFTIVEDDIFAELAPSPTVQLASLAGLARVIYISSFSKTISPALRAGYLVTTAAMAQRLARTKVLSCVGSSELIEQILLNILTQGHYRRHLNRLRERLRIAHDRTAQEFDKRGVDLAYRPQSGLFVWARLPSREPAGRLWRRALQEAVLLAPGELFRPDSKVTPFWRFNVAHCHTPEVFRFLDSL